MLKRIVIGCILLFALLLTCGAIFISSPQLAWAINAFLPQGWQLELHEKGVQFENNAVALPAFSLHFQDCQLLTAKPIYLHWQNPYQLNLDNAVLDYQCLSQLPQSESETNSFSLSPILALVPETQIEIRQLAWKNLPDSLSPRLAQLLNTPSQVKLSYVNNILSTELAQQAVKFEGKIANEQLTGNLFYQPAENEKHNLFFTAQLNENLLDPPHQFEADYHWLLPKEMVDNPILQEGSALLNWSPDDEKNLVGTAKISFEKEPQNQLNLPFKFDLKSLYIYQGKFNWEWLPDFPINGSTTATFTPASIVDGQIFPIQTEFRLNLFSHDKNTLSLATTKGVIKNSAEFDLPLTLSGNVKYNSFQLSSLSTIYANEKGMKFSPKSVFHIISGQERFIKIRDLTIPLGDIQFDRYGVTGRFQAHFEGDTPDFKAITLDLDGQASNFKMGFLDFFDDFQGDKTKRDIWRWTLAGNAHLNALNSQIDLLGKGQWHKDLVQIHQLNGLMASVKQSGIVIPKTELHLTKSIKFDYENWALTGEGKLKSPEILFDYGGKLNQLEASLHFDGQIESLNFDGKLQAGSIGPIQLKAQRELTEQAKSSRFHGQLTWNKQPANVFQVLIPERQNWIIKNGTVSGNTIFHTQYDGSLNANGQISIKNGGISTPKGNIDGIEFSLPYQLNGSQFRFGRNKPIAVNIAEINMGLPITDIHLNVSGYYPYSRQKPLNLTRLTMKLLDGKLEVERFALPQVKPAYLELENIRLESIMDVIQYQQIELKGRANARLPFWLDGNPCYVCNGELSQSAPSNLKISKELMKAISASSGYSERILLYLLNDTRINDLTSHFQVDKSGELTLDAKLKLQLNQQENTKVNFNYTHKENLFHLWYLINSGSYVEQQLENELYQKLDNRP